MRTSSALDAADLAGHFGGGGHPRAAGCTLDGSIADAEAVVLAEARSRLDRLAVGSDGQHETDA